jgi:hypothetical protein
MALLGSLFGKKKKEFKASCAITKEPIEPGYGYLLTTAQIVASRKYWDMIMTEPETMSYSIAHFKNQSSGTQMRSMIFDKYATVAKPWIISDSIISYFDNNDKAAARANSKKWWESEGQYVPENSGPAAEHLDASVFQDLKNYAILEAGRERTERAIGKASSSVQS